MNKISKLIASLLCVTAVAASVAGCGGNKDSATKGGVHEVNVLLNTGSSKSYYEAKVAKFNDTIGKEKKIKIILDTKVDSNYAQAIEIAMQSDQLPDLFSYGDLKKLSEADMVVPLDELDGTEEIVEKYKDYMSEGSHKLGDKIYSLPSGMTVRGLVYNKDMFKAAGIVDEKGEPTPPETYAEMVEYAKKLTNESKMQYGIIFPLKWSAWVQADILDAMAPSCGTNGYDPTTGTYDYSGAKDLLNAILKIKKDGSYYPGAEGMDNDPARAKFSEGQIGMKFAYSFDVGVFNDQFKAKCDWGVAPLPVADKDHKYKQMASVGTGLRVSRRGMDRHGKDVISTVFNYLYNDQNSIELYEQGFSIPCDWNLVKDIDLKDAKHGWKEFCAMADVSMSTPLSMPTNMDGLEKIDDAIVNEIWTGKSDIDTVLKRCTGVVNKAVEEYKKVNPDKDYSIYIDKEWDSAR